MRKYVPKRDLPYVAKTIFLGLVYFVAGSIGFALYPVHSYAALIWPPTGIALATLILYGYNLWPGITFAAFFLYFFSGLSPLASASIAIGNTLQAIIGTYLLRRYARGHFERFESLHDTVTFIYLTAIFSTMISATIGTLTLFIGNTISVGAVSSTWLAWWVGDMIAALILTPFLITWLLPRKEPLPRIRILEIIVFILTIILANLFIFWHPIADLKVPLLYLTSLPLIWGGLRLGSRGTTLAIFMLSLLALVSTLFHHGPFFRMPLSEGLLYLQIFLGTMTVTFLIFATIVKERRHAMNDLRDHVYKLQDAVEKISSADQAKNDFLAILAHELRNPLAPVLSSIELMKISPQTLDMPQFTKTIDSHIRDIVRLLDDLLDVSRISQKKFTLQKEVFDLRSSVQHSLDTVAPLIQRRGHKLMLEYSTSEPIWIFGDPLRVEQMIVNLLTNAAKYTDPGGTITLYCKRQDHTVIISVKDTGVGIAPHMLTRIFDQYQQIDKEKNRSRGGLGLGLSLSKRLAELHNGTIVAESGGVGKGSTFILTLPISPVTGQKETTFTNSTQLPLISMDKKQYKVLVVDDNEAAAHGLGTLLEHKGHEVELAYDGAGAVHSALSDHPRVIVLDIGLPDMDGYEVAAKLRADIKTPLTIIALTGFGQEEDKQRAKQAGCDYHLTKPVSIDDIEKILETL